MEEYNEGAELIVMFALQTGAEGPMSKLACKVPAAPVPVLLEVVVPVPTVTWTSTSEPHSSPAATV
jgi:hypothetical protein